MSRLAFYMPYMNVKPLIDSLNGDFKKIVPKDEWKNVFNFKVSNIDLIKKFFVY